MGDALASLGSAGIRFELLGEILLAAALGAVIGIERQLSNKAAGFRTNVLIAVGAALWMQIGELIAGGEHDPSRIPSEVASGIGFIGAGAILVARGQVVHGLTTAATIWVVAAIGVAVGAHAYTMAVGTTVLVLGTLFVLGKIEARYLDQSLMTVTIGIADRAGAADAMEKRLADRGLEVRQAGWEKSAGRIDVAFHLAGESKARDEALRELAADPEILKLVRAAAAPNGGAG